MKINLLAIRDIKTSHFENRVMPAVHSGELVREFEDLKKNPETRYGKHPEDFNLYVLGSFDTETGTLEPIPPVMLA